MGAGVHIRVDPHRDRGHLAHLPGDAIEDLQFRRGFQVEAVNPQLQRPGHLSRLLAHAGEYHLTGVCSRSHHPLQLAAGDDIETRTQACQQVEDREVGIGLYRITDQVVTAI